MFALTVGLALVRAGAPIGVDTLLPEMVDLDHLARRSRPYYACAQASSYDRNAKSPTQNWFANGDAGQYLRSENRDGRLERVMADLKGPGTIVRIWSANPSGVLRFYFDGEAEPRLAVKAADLLSGKVPPMGDPFAYTSSAGWNLYFPIPYAQSLKVTVDNTDNDGARGMYYHVGYRTYETGTVVRTFDLQDCLGMAPTILTVGRRLLAPPRSDAAGATRLRGPAAGEEPRGTYKAAGEVLPGRTVPVAELPGGLAIHRMTFRIANVDPKAKWGDPRSFPQMARRLVLRMDFDGERCVDVPIGDFFGVAPGIKPYANAVFDVSPGGTMTCRFPMPFARQARVSLTNTGSVPIGYQAELAFRAWKWDDDSYHFRAQWNADFGGTRPMRDMTYLDAKGEGKFVGSSLHVANPVPTWWGEGDEKVFVDGETFPSTFGTGTEDYYGYAWCSPAPFVRPYHAQPRCDGPGNRGHTVVNRFHLFDPIPFEKSLRFDMEMWHWADVKCTWAYTAFWYAKPGGSPISSRDPRGVPFPELAPPGPVMGALEGEKFEVVRVTGGELSPQSGFWETSGGEQLWWRHMKVGDTLTVRVPVAKAGRYEVVGHFCGARDYGKHRLNLNGKAAGAFDFWRDGLAWELKSLGVHDLPAGKIELTVVCEGSREGAVAGSMFGLDYLLLKPVSSGSKSP
ncbi:MAG: DUF2961 domain-containing protein [Fimbriimonadaceae bacterium]|nr:DUF2961 domain-containing protein [Fimbriimonadaceae bacterium]